MYTGTGATAKRASLGRVSQFIEEVGRRRVWRTGLAYAAVVFVLLQLGEIIFPAFGAPEWALRLLVVACFLALPLILALAWAFDITPDGIQRTGTTDDPSGASTYSGSTLPRLTLVAVILATVGGLGWWTVQDTVRARPSSPADSPEGLMAAGIEEEPALQVRSLAVLPLDDFSEEEGGEYFTAGLHEELVSQLSQIGSARVISRTTVVQYDTEGKTMPLIAADLGVEGVIEGSVFRDGDRVRITVQLIHGPTDQHLWANSYDGTLEDAIGLQRTVAQAIAKEIRAEISPDEPFGIPEKRVAASPRVQEEYLRGRFDRSKATPEGLASAIEHFEAAVHEDSSFAPAYAGLAGTRLLQGFHAGDSVKASLLVDQNILGPLEMAFKLDEDSPEARAILFTIRESLGESSGLNLPEGFQILGDSTSQLEADIAFTASEFGRQLNRVVVQKDLQGHRRPSIPPSKRLAEARRLQATADFETAEVVVRAAIEAAPGSEEAWEALEQLKTRQKDYEGVAQVRKERAAMDPAGATVGASVEELEVRLAERGGEGFWSWRIEELQAREEAGEEVSPVLLARAFMGLEQTDEALQALHSAVESKDRNLVSLWTDPAWDSLRTDPRFRDILAKARKNRREQDLFPEPGF